MAELLEPIENESRTLGFELNKKKSKLIYSSKASKIPIS